MHPEKQRKARARRCEITVAITTVKGNMAPELMGGTSAARAKYITPPRPHV